MKIKHKNKNTIFAPYFFKVFITKIIRVLQTKKNIVDVSVGCLMIKERLPTVKGQASHVVEIPEQYT